MARKKWRYQESFELIDIGDHQVPLKLIRESRKNVRTSVGKDAVYLRIPFWTNRNQQRKLRDWCIKWLKNKHQKTGILKSLQKGLIQDGYIIPVPENEIVIRIEYASRKTGRGIIKGNEMLLKLPHNMQIDEEQNLCRKIINNLLGQRFQASFESRVCEINQRYFEQEINAVKLRYNYSKWGSCSSSNNISLSTRLIFAPVKVVDYVIVHELAHLIELNHSARFWQLVEKVMPNFEEYEKWLRENAWSCDY